MVEDDARYGHEERPSAAAQSELSNRFARELPQKAPLVVCRAAGVMDGEGSLQSEQQNILLRVLGREPDVEVDVNEVAIQAGDYLLLCSDGLTRMVPEPAMARAILDLRDPQRICDHLVDTANRHGGADNVTIVVVEMMASWWRRAWSARRWQA